MARIRSVHPSFFTDEAVVSCSALARLLYIGLWTDADDQGVFEWKPLQIKMRLLPGDNADAGALLAELLEAGLIRREDVVGKPFGFVRDFRRFQRPKKPNQTHLLPAELRTYVGLGCDDGEAPADQDEAVPHQFPTKGEKSPQMEDGGEDVREERKEEGFAFPVERAEPSDGEGGRPLAVSAQPQPAKPRSRAREKPIPTTAEQASFDAFWAIYPRKVAKLPALEVYLDVVRRGVSPDEIASGASAYAGSRAGKDPEKTAHATTWLNQGRWTDEIEQPPPGGYRDNGRAPGWNALDMAAEAIAWPENQQ